MKIEKKETFSPVTITLETQEELDFFASVFYNVGGEAGVDIFGGTSCIVRELESIGGCAKRYVPVEDSVSWGINLEEKK